MGSNRFPRVDLEDSLSCGGPTPHPGCLADKLECAPKVKTIEPNGGLWLGSPPNYRMVPTRRMAESTASGSVIFRRHSAHCPHSVCRHVTVARA